MRDQKKEWTNILTLATADKETRKFVEEHMSETRIFVDMLLRGLTAAGHRIHAEDFLRAREQITWVRPK